MNTNYLDHIHTYLTFTYCRVLDAICSASMQSWLSTPLRQATRHDSSTTHAMYVCIYGCFLSFPCYWSEPVKFMHIRHIYKLSLWVPYHTILYYSRTAHLKSSRSRVWRKLWSLPCAPSTLTTSSLTTTRYGMVWFGHIWISACRFLAIIAFHYSVVKCRHKYRYYLLSYFTVPTWGSED